MVEAIKSTASAETAENPEALDDGMTLFRDYVNKIDDDEKQIRLAAVSFEGEEYREMFTQHDRHCHDQHEEMITNVWFVNQLAQLYSAMSLFTDDDKERLQAADFCLDVVVQIFQNRMM